MGGLGIRAADNSGVTGDLITNKGTLQIIGTGIVGGVVEVREGGTLLGSGVVAGTGRFSVEITRPEGSHTLSVTQADVAGNVSTATTTTIIIDQTIATPVVGSVSGGAINATEAAAGGITVPVTGLENGATLVVTAIGTNVTTGAPLSVTVPMVSGVPTLSSAVLAQFANGPLTLVRRPDRHRRQHLHGRNVDRYPGHGCTGRAGGLRSSNGRR